MSQPISVVMPVYDRVTQFDFTEGRRPAVAPMETRYEP